ncbi:neuropeptide CCHamide-1 receptor-like [Centruroides vittatus]|uniref:neuropeptide CCHamide-1 receptor-like n=1 Tax=Centruroides vittatus TaxID=120091 RepID=UPI0035102D7F
MNSLNGSVWLVETHNDSNVTQYSYIPYHQRLETYILPIIFAVIFFVGLIGNGTLVYIFLHNRTMRSVPNIYIMSLALGDLIVIVGNVPFTSTIYLFDAWPYGEFICKLSEFLRDVSIAVTVLTLTMLSVDRYIAIALPIQKVTGSHAKTLTVVIAIFIWCVSVAISVPGAYYSFLLEMPLDNDKVVYVCYPFPEDMSPWYPRTMVLLKFLSLYVVPLSIIASFYVLMAKQLLKSTKNTVGQNDSHTKQMKARVKVAKIVLVFVFVFAVCFFPSQVFLMWFYFYPNAGDHYNYFWHILKMSGYVLTFVNSCLNPIALYFISGVYRKYYKRYLCCCHNEIHKNTMVVFRTFHTTSVRNHSLGTTITKI